MQSRGAIYLMRLVRRVVSSLEDLPEFPDEVKRVIGFALP